MKQFAQVYKIKNCLVNFWIDARVKWWFWTGNI